MSLCAEAPVGAIKRLFVPNSGRWALSAPCCLGWACRGWVGSLALYLLYTSCRKILCAGINQETRCITDPSCRTTFLLGRPSYAAVCFPFAVMDATDWPMSDVLKGWWWLVYLLQYVFVRYLMYCELQVGRLRLGAMTTFSTRPHTTSCMHAH